MADHRRDTGRRGGGDARGVARSLSSDRFRPLVLLVEDDAHDREIYGKILWYNGFDVVAGENGEEGVALAHEHQPDVVIVDLVMPRLNGIEVCRRIKADPATEDVPVIALSGRARYEFGDLALSAGCVQYLEKPINPLRVLEAVESLVGRPPPAGEGVHEGTGDARDV